MLNVEDNKLLTETGQGTPMGEYLRRYWVPVLPTEDVGDPLSAPVRVTVFGEQLVAFRGEDGQVGLVEETCAHRCASLYFGRNEPGGIRCIYHGWKFDRSGQCIEQPTEPASSRFRDKIRIRAYEVRERAGIVWAYFGPPEEEPAFPELEWLMVPDDHVFVSMRLQESNFLQAIEGGIDSSHVSVLHKDASSMQAVKPSKDWDRLFDDSAPRFYIEPTDYGLAIGARRDTADERHYWRVTQYVLPWYTFVPRDADGPINAHAWVPLDDGRTWTWSISYHPDRPLTRTELDRYRSGKGIHAEAIQGTHVPIRNKSNEYLINRDLARAGFFSGIHGIPAQDTAVQESMGPIVDRTREHLGTSDAAILLFRRRLLAAAKALRDENQTPVGLNPELHRVRSAAVVLDRDVAWLEATADVCAARKDLYVDKGL